MNIAIVVAPYHEPVRKMLEVTREKIEAYEWASLHSVKTVFGAFEIPLQVDLLLAQKEVDAVITLSAIERGETGHGVAIANAVFPALINIGIRHSKPVALGIIGPNATREQIESRAIPVANSALTALELLREK